MYMIHTLENSHTLPHSTIHNHLRQSTPTHLQVKYIVHTVYILPMYSGRRDCNRQQRNPFRKLFTHCPVQRPHKYINIATNWLAEGQSQGQIDIELHSLITRGSSSDTYTCSTLCKHWSLLETVQLIWSIAPTLQHYLQVLANTVQNHNCFWPIRKRLTGGQK